MNGAKMAFKMPIKMSRRRSLDHPSMTATSTHAQYSPFNQDRPILALQEYLPHSSTFVKQVLHQTEPEVPLERSRERLTFAVFRRPEERKPLQEERKGHTKVKQLLIEKRNEVVLLTHDSIRDVMRVQLGCH